MQLLLLLAQQLVFLLLRNIPYSTISSNEKSELHITKYSYRVVPVYLADKDADIVRQRLQEKKENGELFTEEVIKNIIEEFSLSDEEAEKYMKMYW